MSGALQAVFQNQRSFVTPPSQQAYTTAGTFSWVAPTGVTRISVVAVGGGGGGGSCAGGGGGALGYKNNITVVPGCSYNVIVGAGGSANANGARSAWGPSCNPNANPGMTNGAGGTYTGDGGGNGGAAGTRGAGGAGGYVASGGVGGGNTTDGGAGTGGGGGGGGGNTFGQLFTASYYYQFTGAAGAGGGVGLLGQGISGFAGSAGGCAGTYSTGGTGGGGGSGGANGGTGGNSGQNYGGASGNGGAYGGGGGGRGFSATYQLPCYCPQTYYFLGTPGTGSKGAVRIIWPGCARSFPSTRTADE